MGLMGSCRQGDHEACIRTVYPERKDCSCACHKLSSMRVDHKPTSRDPRVKSRQQSWNGSWWLAAWPGYVEEYRDESIIREPLTPEELWKRQYLR
jgi:hypothetical protein